MENKETLIKGIKEMLSVMADNVCEINGNLSTKFFQDTEELPIDRAVFDIDSDIVWLDNITEDGFNTIDIDSCPIEVIQAIYYMVKA